MSTDRPADEIVAEAKAAKRMKEEEDSDTAAQSMFSKPQFKEQKVWKQYNKCDYDAECTAI